MADNQDSSSPILQIRDLKMHFPVKEGILLRTGKYNKAVDGVSLIYSPVKPLAWWVSPVVVSPPWVAV